VGILQSTKNLLSFVAVPIRGPELEGAPEEGISIHFNRGQRGGLALPKWQQISEKSTDLHECDFPILILTATLLSHCSAAASP